MSGYKTLKIVAAIVARMHVSVADEMELVDGKVHGPPSAPVRPLISKATYGTDMVTYQVESL